MIALYGIDTSHFTGKGWKGNSVLYSTDEYFAENSKKSRDKVRRRILRDNLIPYKCACCGNTGEWMGKVISLELDHINGISNDNRLENLRFLCPNCHATTDTYCGKNVDIRMPNVMEIAVLATKMTKKEIAKQYGVSCDTIDRWCRIQGAPSSMKGLAELAIKEHPELAADVVQKINKPKKKRNEVPSHLNNLPFQLFCRVCGKPVKGKTGFCRPCSERRVVVRPSPIEIATMVKETNFLQAGKHYGVTDNAVRKWCRAYGIPTHTKELIEWLDHQNH